MSEEKAGFLCSQCGEWHEELLSDMGFQLPDVVWELEYLEKYKRSSFNKDFCTLDGERYFIRCVMCVPFNYKEGYFGWGLWVEVSKENHDRCLETYYEGSDAVPPFVGEIANNIKIFPDLIGQQVRVKLYDDHRPFIELLEASTHPLAAEQRSHISLERHHEIASHFA